MKQFIILYTALLMCITLPATLFAQTDTAKSKNSIAKTPLPRTSIPEESKQLVLRSYKNKTRLIRIIHKENDLEAEHYADVFCDFMKANGYTNLKCGSKSIYPGNFYGVALDTVGYTIHVAGNK